MNARPDSQATVREPRRRQLLQGIAGIGLTVGSASLAAACSRLAQNAQPAQRITPSMATGAAALETTTLRLGTNGAMCFAPKYLADDLLRAEGFTSVEYPNIGVVTTAALVSGQIDMAMATVGVPILQADIDNSVTILAGIHVGCFELFANASLRSMSDLQGKRVAVTGQGSGRHIHLAAMAAYVGIDPARDMTLVFDGPSEAIRQFTAGQVDAFMAFPPEPQELRARGTGHVLVNTTTDRPWSQYYCCVLAANRAFVDAKPVATKRALRAILKATDLCATEPERAAQVLIDRGYAREYHHARQMLQELSYTHWREYDPEDTVRFYSLRLQEIGMIKSTPDRIISQGTDLRFFNELRQELKG